MRTFDAPAWLVATDGMPPDDLDQTPADDFGRFACGECADNRDAAERTALQLKKAHSLLHLIARTEQRAAKREGDETAHELALIGFACAVAAIKARIEVYFQAAR
jgi:hypothetical protein